MKKNIQFIAQAGIIAAIYTALTLALAPISFGIFQFRISEALTILPVFTSAAIPGLTIGCALSNAAGLLLGANVAGPLDIILGSFATLLAALCTRALRKLEFKKIPILSLLPPVIFNGLIIGYELFLFVPEAGAFYIIASQVALEESVICFVLGIPLFLTIKKMNIFSDRSKNLAE